MATEDMKDDRKDADEADFEKKGGPETTSEKDILTQMLTTLGDAMKRMDSIEESLKDRRDAAKADAEDEHEEEERDDAEEDEDAEKGEPVKAVTDKRKDAKKDAKPRMDGKRKDSRRMDAKKEEDERDDAEDERDDEDDEEGMMDARADSVTIPRALFETLKSHDRAIKDLQRTAPKDVSDKDHAEMVAIQARADSVMGLFGKQAPRPLMGEGPLSYRRRLARELQGHSRAWAKTNLSAIADAAAMDVIEAQIYADAEAAALDVTSVPYGHLRPVVRTDSTGRRITSFAGDPKAWLSDFMLEPRKLSKINNQA